ncbi:DUF2281 domain-containing protein [Planktothrix agardhii 1806]|jgi:hypothetical protein|uniref:DUF2281 domain-containing protein n=1 Tax=Planktothrix agardhii TaxID=1160 RepID=UPI001D0BB9C0|nr:DUF2281 domain-containing protein [Planktothrix agardhii]MCB8760962.1 DUF2281 domain-containing protein [Planktothrix agardhii 1813]MCB8776876.1 DUF2281 domain-containing protein [Planktothrix agardhii 1031]MCB8785628.1 DUF2281 domain-containing protein [Planktothrix agardhii 1025]MCF3569941.1 DUF2281 domain-containing protein [Planktothrix agardhii 1805]MCF3586948.1 DUF2281 domain-containing protein [Planktothrix agardhii 1803]
MTIIEQIYAIVKSLPQEQASEILTFAKFIRAQHLNANPSIAILDTSTPWAELVYSLAGTWEKDFPTLEDIRAELGEDILRESF